LAIIRAFQLDFHTAFWLIVTAAVFDFFDGFAARLLKVTSGIGKQLDSLADMVTFGVAPGIMVLIFMKSSGANDDYLYYIALLIPVFSALRLAKFNIDERQTEGFLGLPTPANALFFSSLVIFDGTGVLFEALKNLNVMSVIVIVFCFLMISEIPLLALKFKSFKWKDNQMKYIFLILAAVLSAIFFFQATPFIILLYILISLINNKLPKHEIQSRN
jgi:CDP-diacylglycerol--serine O-phosphatidyltransferase